MQVNQSIKIRHTLTTSMFRHKNDLETFRGLYTEEFFVQRGYTILSLRLNVFFAIQRTFLAFAITPKASQRKITENVF
jgi:hypothetical protein